MELQDSQGYSEKPCLGETNKEQNKCMTDIMAIFFKWVLSLNAGLYACKISKQSTDSATSLVPNPGLS